MNKLGYSEPKEYLAEQKGFQMRSKQIRQISRTHRWSMEGFSIRVWAICREMEVWGRGLWEICAFPSLPDSQKTYEAPFSLHPWSHCPSFIAWSTWNMNRHFCAKALPSNQDFFTYLRCLSGADPGGATGAQAPLKNSNVWFLSITNWVGWRIESRSYMNT